MSSEYRPPLAPVPAENKSRVPWILGGCAVLLLIAIGLSVGGYAFYRWRVTNTINVNASPESPRGGAADNRPPDQSASAEPVNNNSNQPAAQSSGVAKPTSWETNASALTGPDGTTFTLTCSPNGTMHSVWGSDVYTVDSSICTAAVHAGLVTFERGGTVTIELRPGRAIYGNSERNGVATSDFGAYGRSFVFKSQTRSDQAKETEEVTPVLWNASTSILSIEAGKTWKFSCPAAGKASTVWGTDVYTGDSSICTAAVHAGVITFDRGGTVTVELRPGQSSYKGTTRNGVTSIDYASYGRSFVVR
jgi:hypothetical protein